LATNQQFSEEQLRAARKPLWQQAGEPVLTAEAASEFVDQFGLVPFAPARLGVVAPTLVEATLGAENPEPSAADTTVARDLLSRMTADGSALPLNLLGGGGETPDFVVSGAAFRFVFTLRGDKSWKQAPATSGAAKVSPLALRVFEVLTERGALSAQELAAELGREVTEAAIVRALNELWQMLRVIPLLQQGGGATLWELTTRRFTRGIKAGVNAGQPTALSALVSLYLKQMISATGEEIETFLSPLTARSRVREVLHALVAARELGEVVVNGKTLLHISGELPEFADVEAPEAEGEEGAEPAVKPAPREYSETETPEPGRIRKFDGERREAPRTREAGNVAFKRTPRDAGEKKPYARRDKAEYTKPWDEERKPRPRAGSDREGGERPKRAFGEKREFGARGPRKEFGERKPFTPREGGERKPYTPREGGERKPFRPRKPFDGDRQQRAFGGDRERKPFVRRERTEGEGERPSRPRTPFDSDRPKRAFGGDRERKPFVRREGSEGGGERPFRPRKPFDSDRPKRAFGGDRERKPFVKREGGEERPFRPRKPFDSDRPKRAFGGDRERKPFVKREGGDERASRPRKPFDSDRPKRAFGGDRERKPFVRRDDGAQGDRPARKPFGAKPGGKAFGAKPAGKFGGPKKFAGGPKKFASGPKRGPAAGKPGGFGPTSRKPRRDAEE
jgi:hypothetical protein